MANKEIIITNEYCLDRFNDWYEHGFSHSEMPSSGVLMKMKEALERQTPKKPTYRFRPASNPYLGDDDSYLCPNCGHFLAHVIREKYCDRCGQAIDWSK